MSTDVFNSFWNDPKKQYVYTNLTCGNTKSDDELSFNINDGNGEISNNNEVLYSLDLSTISPSLTSYTNSTKIIPAKSLLFVGSESNGKSYKKIVYGKFSEELLKNVDWQSETTIKFNICWIKDDNTPAKLLIEAKGTIEEDVVDVINKIFNENGINVVASLQSLDDKEYNLLSFDGGKEGYDFYIDNISYCILSEEYDEEYINNDNVYNEFLLEEVNLLYVPAYKYKNGAFKGIVVKPIYPLYNNSIDETAKSLKVCHLKDRVTLFIKNNRGEYFKKILDVYGNHFDVNEFNSCIIFKDKNNYINDDLDDMWLNDEENEWVIIENGYKVLRNNYCGLYGYANYATINDLWINFGEVYMAIANEDDPSSSNCNLIKPIILYNPNDFDVKVNILTFEE